jgi:cytoskeletal protein CcmA (bactofilin family)
MFNRRRPLKVENNISQTISAILDKGCEFEGKLCFEGTARIGGKFRGEIITKDSVIISEGAAVEGRIDADIVIINGEVTGDILAKSRVEIHKPAVLRGSITTNSLFIEEGVVFEGTTKMLKEDVDNVLYNGEPEKIIN